ncbi:efflux RND transporter periplasmic adaptor subunit [Haloferula chungangensis]|uniref:Efflux RND transporter periplasmic adaptor subunit n=1 Tax=Haloferula chungangensis TaxID=1048331 RepID=A0ABW2LCN0_9BACT
MKPLTILLLFTLLVACEKKPQAVAPQPLPVTVANPERRDVVVYKKFPATLEGSAEIEIRARVQGILEKANFKDGDLVEAGTELFVIEPEPYQLAVEAAAADVRRARSSTELADKRYQRVKKAGETRAVSEIDVEIASAELAQTAASVAQAEAQLEEAKINASYTTISAPVRGRMSRSLVDPGNLVGATESTLLATIIDDSQMRAYFEVPERAMIKYLGERALEGGVERFADKAIRLELADGSIYDKPGKIDFINNQIDPSTRTAKVRAVFPNPNAELSSGLYGLIGFPAGPDPNDTSKSEALLVPSTAILRDLGGSFVWIVDETNTVRRMGVTVGDSVETPSAKPGQALHHESVIIEEEGGLSESHRVIVSGLQRAREGAVVAPTMVTDH